MSRLANTSSLRKAKEDHDKFLLAMGAHPSQLKQRKSNSKKNLSITNKPKPFVSDGIKTSDTIQPGGQARGIMVNLHKEAPHVQRAILEKAAQCTTLYNKGAYGLPVKSDGNILGSQSRRL
jgi:hypothetical protein